MKNVEKGFRKKEHNYYICYRDVNGVQREKAVGKSIREARALRERRLTEAREGKQPELSLKTNMTLREFAPDYLDWAKRQKSYDRTVSFVGQLVGRYGNVPLKAFTSKHVEVFQSECMARGLKEASINRIVAVLRKMLSKAEEWHYITEYNLQQVRKAKQFLVDNRRLRFLSLEECKRLEKACDEHLRPIVIVGIHTGMRKGELLSLTWDRVNIVDGIIFVEDTKNGESRQLPLDNKLRETLFALPRHINCNHVFFNPRTVKPYTDIKKAFSSARERARIKDCTFHTLRHTYASHLVMNGVDLPTLQVLLGHKDYKMTSRYAHLSPSHTMKAVNALNSIFKCGQNVGKTEEVGNANVS